MKIHPKAPSEFNPRGGFTAEEIRSGDHWLRTDVECVDCGKAQTLANAGSTDNGKCIACGGRVT